jgi:endonuclease/exonuclease/phosphatase family metal-dependent hydrolase
MKNLKFYDRIVYFINGIVATVLLLSYLLPFLAPKTFALLSVVSLTVPILILINIAFLLYWLLKLKRQALFSGLVLCIGFKYVSSLYQFSTSKDIHTSHELSVLSYNVRNFNRYDWIKDAGKPVEQQLVDLIKTADADVLCIQEYYRNSTVDLSLYPHQYIKLKGNQSKTGQAIFSKYPILREGSIQFPKTGNNAIYIDVLKAADTLRIYNVHLESLGINPDVEELTDQDSEKLIKRIGNTFKMQESQAEILLAHMKNCTHKKIVCGDFNNSPYSYVYRNIKGDMIDAFEAAGTGFGKTFDFKLFPLRIDFILADPSLEVNAFQNFDEAYSDHFPVYARFNLND